MTRRADGLLALRTWRAGTEYSGQEAGGFTVAALPLIILEKLKRLPLGFSDTL